MTLPERDTEGFLVNLNDWTPEVGRQMALADGLELTDAHWEIIELVRHFYDETGVSPVQRVLVKLVRERLGEEKGQSIYLMQLFPGSPARLTARYAGLPKPANCL